MSKRLGGIVGCKDKTSSWHLIGFRDGTDIGSAVSCRGETHRRTQSPRRDTKQNKNKRHDEPVLQLNLLHWASGWMVVDEGNLQITLFN